MQTATVKEIKTELTNRSHKELLELCLTLSKFKKENKELLTYLLYEAQNEDSFINSVKVEVEEMFKQINTRSYYLIKKAVRKILRTVKKYIRYSKKKTTQVELLLHFCQQLKRMHPTMTRSKVLVGIYQRQIAMIKKTVKTLHEDLQYDYNMALEDLRDNY